MCCTRPHYARVCATSMYIDLLLTGLVPGYVCSVSFRGTMVIRSSILAASALIPFSLTSVEELEWQWRGGQRSKDSF